MIAADPDLGMLAHVDEAKRREALALVREGRLFDLGRILDERVPVFPGRYFRQTLVTTAHHGNDGGVGENQVNWITELVTGTQQLGTHLDALSHLQIGDRGYNGWSVAELADTAGVKHLGIETVPQIVTRGWLVDVTGLGPGGVVSRDDLAGIDPTPGDAVLFHTGWGEHWDDAEMYLSGEPGPGCDVASWHDQQAVVVAHPVHPHRAQDRQVVGALVLREVRWHHRVRAAPTLPCRLGGVGVGQGRDPVHVVHGQRVPAVLPGASRLVVGVQHDVADPEPGQVVRRREAGLAGADHDRVVGLHARSTTAGRPVLLTKV